MTVSEKKMIEEMQKKLDLLTRELDALKKSNSNGGFERLETDNYLTEAHN